MERIHITKMQGCGNDFILLDFKEYEKTNLSMSELAIKLCDRHFGVGADGMIIPKLDTRNTDIAWYFYNNDGSTAQMCGNGMRCFAKYVYDKGLTNKTEFSVETGAGIIKPEILEDGMVRVNMGTPILEDNKIPFKGERKITIQDMEFEIFPVSMGNPHCIIFTEKNPMDLAKKYGPEIEVHPYFPEKTNTEFVKIISKDEIDMQVFERGCGITYACGTGACASVVASCLKGFTNSKVKVNLFGGSVYIEWINQENIYLTGPAEYSFEADVNIS